MDAAAAKAFPIRDEFIKVVFQQRGVPLPGSEALAEVGTAVNRDVGALLDKAVMLMRMARRKKLTVEDVNEALRVSGRPTMLGYSAHGELSVVPVGHGALLSQEELTEVTDSLGDLSLPPPPMAPTVSSHWLAIDGVQPPVPQNPPPRTQDDADPASALSGNGSGSVSAARGARGERAVSIRNTQHVLSREMTLLLDQLVRELGGHNPHSRARALSDVRSAKGLQPLSPYLVHHVATTVDTAISRKIAPAQQLRALRDAVDLAAALLANPAIEVDRHLHQLLPALISCAIARALAPGAAADAGAAHWCLRRDAASCIALACKRFGSLYHDLTSRVTQALHAVVSNPKKALTSHYGAIQGLALLGPTFVQHYLRPIAQPYHEAALRAIHRSVDKASRAPDAPSRRSALVKADEARQCWMALLHAVGTMLREWRRALVASVATSSGDLHALARLAGSSLPATASVPVAEYLRRGPPAGAAPAMPFSRLGQRSGARAAAAAGQLPSTLLPDAAAAPQPGAGNGAAQRVWVLPAAQRSALRRLCRGQSGQVRSRTADATTASEDGPPSRKRARQESTPQASASAAATAAATGESRPAAAATAAGQRASGLPFGQPQEEADAQACPRVCVRVGTGRGQGGGRKRTPAAGSLEHEPALHCYWLDTSGVLPNPALVAL